MTEHQGAGHRNGFTLVEMLVVILIIVILISLSFSSLTNAIERARRAACAANLHNLSTGIIGFAAAYDGRTPAHVDAPWMWHVSNTVVTNLNPFINERKQWFCPSSSEFKYMRYNWDEYNKTHSYRISSYFNMLVRTGQGPTIVPGRMRWVSNLRDPGVTADTEMMADAAHRQQEWRNDMTSDSNHRHRSNHIRNDGVPHGSNIAYADGHVQWRNASIYLPLGHRASSSSGGPTTYFYY